MKFILSFFARLFWNIIYYVKLALSYLNIPAFIYDMMITKTVTYHTYINLFNQLEPRLSVFNKILDIGCGTGYALNSIVHLLPTTTEVIGIDIDKSYIQAA